MPELNIEEYKKLQNEVSQLKSQLTDINQNKEHWFKHKEDLKKEIANLILKIKEIKNEKDKKNLELDELKKQRDFYNTEVKTLINTIKEVNEEKSDAFKKYNIRVDPKNIQYKINELEKKVEIETNFEKEKKLMIEIRKLKKTYGEVSELAKISEKESEISRNIRTARKKANEFHQKIIDITKNTSYDVFIILSKKINELKKIQEEAFQKFIEYKNEYSNINYQLNSRSEDLGVLRAVFSQNKEIKKIEKHEKDRKIIAEKTKQVEHKLKTKRKITTEDLIILQGKDIID